MAGGRYYHYNNFCNIILYICILQVELFCAIPTPQWINRPYLNGSYFLLSDDQKATSELENRYFPKSYVSIDDMSKGTTDSIPLDTQTTGVQQLVSNKYLFYYYYYQLSIIN